MRRIFLKGCRVINGEKNNGIIRAGAGKRRTGEGCKMEYKLRGMAWNTEVAG